MFRIIPNWWLLTSLHHVVHGGETFEYGRADRAEDQQGRQTGVAHHGSSQQAASLVTPLEAPWQDAHEPVRERDAGVLAPPPVHHQGHIETCKYIETCISPTDQTLSDFLFTVPSSRFPRGVRKQQVTFIVTLGASQQNKWFYCYFFYGAQMFRETIL